MVYILYYDFPNTSGNHAGMAYLARHLQQENQKIKLLKHIKQERRGGRYLGLFYAWYLAALLLIKLKKTDSVFFLEYLSGTVGYQDKIAGILRFLGKRNEFIAMVHLSGSHLLEFFQPQENLLARLQPINKIVVLGNSLRNFLIKLGFKGDVIQTYHYVDTAFYKPKKLAAASYTQLNVIFMGSLKRNFDVLRTIISAADSNINFHICAGRTSNDLGLSAFGNVKLYGFLTEDELLALMQSCNVNLSVMDDTVGSNVITCSLAVGLVQVTSNVGSIKDYCDESTSFLCDTVDDFLNALQQLNQHSQRLSTMQHNARLKAESISLTEFTKEFSNFVNMQ